MSDEKSAAESEAGPEIDTGLVRKLAAILKQTDLSEIEVERGDLRIRVARTLTAAPVATYLPAPVAHAPAAPVAAAPSTAAAEPAAKAVPAGDPVNSPMVGTVYRQPAPGAAPFIKAGDTITEGQTLLIIEAMKTMNPIPAPRAGKVLDVLVQDGQAVEFGEPLVILE